MILLSRRAPAKLNLTLAVGPVRPDGYHELESLVALTEFGDTVTVSLKDEPGLTAWCSDPALPTDEQNLAVRAALRLAAEADREPKLHIALEKQIPVGAGLGGGSSNAAATLELLNDLWGLGYDLAQLAALGAEIGSDVPLFFGGPLSVMRGRGEDITPLPQRLRAWAVLLLPDLAVSTPAVYRAFDRLPAPPAPRTIDAVLAARGIDELQGQLFNQLEPAALTVAPELALLFERAGAELGPAVRLTGSGAALFHLYDSEAAAQAAAARAAALSVRVEVTALARV